MTDAPLSREEVAAWTDAHQRRTQIRALIAMNVEFKIGRDGWPKVHRDAVRPDTVQKRPEPRMELVR